MAMIDRIKFDGPSDTLVWKWPNDKIVIGSQLVVNESQEAIFFKGGQALDLFGPGTHTLSTANIPLLQKIINLPFGGQTPFVAEVYFVNRAAAFGHTWGTKKPIMLLDPRYRVTIPLRAYGTFGVRVANAREFVVEVVDGTGSASAEVTATLMLESPIVSCVQQAFGEFLVNRKVSALDIPAHSMAVTELVSALLKERYRTFGIELVNFTVESINFDANDESVKRLRAMLDEAARLEVMADAFRRNQDFYRAERQFDILQSAAESNGAAGNVMAAAMGVGMGFGVATPTSEIAKRSMSESPPTAIGQCSGCGEKYGAGVKFCNKCGQKVAPPSGAECPKCAAGNAPGASFCCNCGNRLEALNCGSCGAQFTQGSRFCGACGAKT
jgi:membrane protease subunit (stomatin/prohibitin family)